LSILFSTPSKGTAVPPTSTEVLEGRSVSVPR
jgi:hypothetical protein